MTIMEWLFNVFKTRKKDPDLVSALEQVIQQVYWGEGLTPDQARASVREGLLEIQRYGHHSCNGLLLTDNGYFLTAHHCIENPSTARIPFQGKTYGIERVCAHSEKDDLALVKLNISGMPKACTYRVYFNLERQTPIILLTRRNGTLIAKHGFVSSPQTQKTFLLNHQPI